jgi:hypothetical protein
MKLTYILKEILLEYSEGLIKKLIAKYQSSEPDIEKIKTAINDFSKIQDKLESNQRDITRYSWDELNKIINANVSNKSLENDYDVIEDNDDVLILAPHTHEASRKLGLTKFAFRDCGNGKKDSAWCTTYKAPDHWNEYYYSRGLTFYYVRVKSPEMIKRIKTEISKDYLKYTVVALEISEDGSKIQGWDGKDNSMGTNTETVKKFINIIGMD